MTIKFRTNLHIQINKDDKQHYRLSEGKAPDRIWINNEEGEGMDCKDYEVCTVLFEAIDKYFKENY